MLHLCSQCLADLKFVEEGHDENHRKFKLYKCPTCGSYVRDFYLTERETVDEAIAEYRDALVTESHSATQLPLFPEWRKIDY